MAGKKRPCLNSSDIMDCYPINLLARVIEGAPAELNCTVWDFSVSDFLTEISRLEKKRSKALELRFKEGKTLAEVGEHLKVTKERARQLETLGIYDLKHKLFSGACRVVRQDEYSKLLGQYNALCEKFELLVVQLPEADEVAPKKIMNCCEDIRNLVISVRTRNCLLRANLRTVTDIIRYDKEGHSLAAIRGMGVSCAEELMTQIYKNTGYRLHI